MKRYILIFAALAVVFVGCVDEYTDANPPLPFDAPAIFDRPVENGVRATRTNGTMRDYTNFGETVRYRVNVPDAPGGIDSLIVTISPDVFLGEIGTITIDEASVTAARGQTSGELFFEYTATEDETINQFVTLTIEVKDQQETPKVTSSTIMIRAYTACLPDADYTGTYSYTSSGFDSETGENYEGLEGTVNLTISTAAATTHHAGRMACNDVSFGLYAFQGFNSPAGIITLCDDGTVGVIGPNAITGSGTYTADGSMEFSWTNSFGDTGDVMLTKN